jgi:hypothetical protein
VNTTLLRQVQAVILAEPKRVDMSIWQVRDVPVHNLPECGTVGCIAGWADILNRTNGSCDSATIRALPVSLDPERAGAAALDLDYPKLLFFSRNWPIDLQLRLTLAPPGTMEYGSVVAEAIDRFIADESEFDEFNCEENDDDEDDRDDEEEE